MDESSSLSAQEILHLREANARLQVQNEQLLAEQAAMRTEKGELLIEKELLLQELKELKRVVFGQKRERFVPAASANQLSLPLEDGPTEPVPTLKQTIIYERAVKQAAKVAIRGGFPSHLPRVDVVIEPQEDISGMRKIGEEITEELDLKPASLFVRRYIRPRYVSKEETFHIAALPTRPIEKGIPGPGLLATIIYDKFVSHLPFYRQVQRYEQLGMKIPASSLEGWFEACCSVLEPLYESLKAQLLSSNYVQVDETPIPVLDKQKKGETHRGYHWVYHAVESKLVLFDYREGRGREGPKELLKNYRGYLQTDGYGVYDMFESRQDIVLVGCMAHARRYFERALDNDKGRAEKVLLWMQELYAIEREAREQNLGAEDRYVLRQTRARPLMEELENWLLTERLEVLPKSAIGKAVFYLIPRFYKMAMYLEDGRLEVDNNLVENAIRPVALGRKNYMFAGSHAGAKRAAIVYSLLGSCKLHGINPYDYLIDILQRLPLQPVNRLKELLPPFWKPANISPIPQPS
ncbi:IS66 family transposase [Rhodocytophaga aerolata]|uniref:IS66 family transposase n=1 Tax=Rhodocytophaga aerolata TaxID=455078 RepID=A0ABT8RGW6_9BACT|nr:IS66 family transposase [Rhodocytophaga aerolata]MDO1451357.1 IS66 family transposase [Rhodocytophaga aerolata]